MAIISTGRSSLRSNFHKFSRFHSGIHIHVIHILSAHFIHSVLISFFFFVRDVIQGYAHA